MVGTFTGLLLLEEQPTIPIWLSGKDRSHRYGKSSFCREMLRHIGQLIDPSKLDYVIMNHMETNHSGSLAELKKPTLKFSSQEGALISSMDTSQTRAVRTGTLRL